MRRKQGRDDYIISPVGTVGAPSSKFNTQLMSNQCHCSYKWATMGLCESVLRYARFAPCGSTQAYVPLMFCWFFSWPRPTQFIFGSENPSLHWLNYLAHLRYDGISFHRTVVIPLQTRPGMIPHKSGVLARQRGARQKVSHLHCHYIVALHLI